MIIYLGLASTNRRGFLPAGLFLLRQRKQHAPWFFWLKSKRNELGGMTLFVDETTAAINLLLKLTVQQQEMNYVCKRFTCVRILSWVSR